LCGQPVLGDAEAGGVPEDDLPVGVRIRQRAQQRAGNLKIAELAPM
jgi:hypothetical protein